MATSSVGEFMLEHK